MTQLSNVLVTNNSFWLKFVYSEKATLFCEICPLILTTVHTVKNKGKIVWPFQNTYMNFTIMGDQNKLSVIKTSDNCVIAKADVWAIKLFQV